MRRGRTTLALCSGFIAMGVLGPACRCTSRAPCPASQTACGPGAGTCTSVAFDPANCGACGSACAAGAACAQGRCVASCDGDAGVLCGAFCVHLLSDDANCGACGAACTAPARCVSGLCTAACGAGQIPCGGACVSPMTDNANCGGCGASCGPGQACSQGQCQVSCAPPLVLCASPSPRCADVLLDPSNCGGCGLVCLVSHNCVGGRCTANPPTLPRCVSDGGLVYADTQSDSHNCGACGVACPAERQCLLGFCAAPVCNLETRLPSLPPYFLTTHGDGHYLSNIAIADMNGDGRPDLVSEGVVVSLATGPGEFAVSGTYPVAGPLVIAVDLTNDGLPDVLAGGLGWTVLVNRGGGVLAQTSQLPGDFGSVADFDGDGVPDFLATRDTFSPTATVYLGLGDGTFDAGSTLTLPGTELAGPPVVADFNGDGSPDILAWTVPNCTLWLLPNDGLGHFGAPQGLANFPCVPIAPSAGFAVADFDGDGRADVVAISASSGALGVGLQLADGGLAPWVSYNARGFDYVAATDVTGDGRPDLIVRNDGLGAVLVLVNVDGGGFSEPTLLLTGDWPAGIAVGDLNQDGLPDIAVAFPNNGSIQFARGAGGGAFAVPTPFGDLAVASSNDRPFGMTDWDRDGRPDAIISSGIALGLADGGFAPEVTCPWATDRVMALSDLNGDGYPDVVSLTGYPRFDLTVLFNPGADAGSACPSASATLVADAGFGFVVAGDLNGDGWQDLIWGDPARRVAVFLNNRGSGFEPPRFTSLSFVPGAMATGDVNRDGFLDLVVGQGQSVGLLLGDGDGGFQFEGAVASSIDGGWVGPIAVADTNHDGWPDIAFYTSSSDVEVVRNLGGGAFAPAASYGAGLVSPIGLALVDMNNDGAADMVATGQGVMVFLSDGVGGFAAPSSGAREEGSSRTGTRGPSGPGTSTGTGESTC